jgi:hypothetical protein
LDTQHCVTVCYSAAAAVKGKGMGSSCWRAGELASPVLLRARRVDRWISIQHTPELSWLQRSLRRLADCYISADGCCSS